MLGQDNSTGLLGLYAFTGCDTVSCFSGKGKVSALRLLTSDRHKDTLKCQSSNWEVSPQFLKSLESLTCSLYTYCAKNEIENINELRFNIFCTRKVQADSWQLSPCASSPENHCKRPNYQSAVWTKSLEVYMILHPLVVMAGIRRIGTW